VNSAIIRIGSEAAALLATLHSACFDRPWSEADFAVLLALPTVEAFIACGPGPAQEPVGFLLAQSAAEQAEIVTMGVLPAYRRAGIGRVLLADAGVALAARGVLEIFLEVNEANRAARQLYRSAGFSAVGRRVGYYETTAGGRADAICLHRRLVADA